MGLGSHKWVIAIYIIFSNIKCRLIQVRIREMNQSGGKMKAAWSSHLAPPVSFNDVMSEQLADLLVEEDVNPGAVTSGETCIVKDEPPASSDLSNGMPDTTSDEALARMLQAEMDKEYNEKLAKEEERVNRYSKVKLSLDNYRASGPYSSDSSQSESEDDDEEDKDSEAGSLQQRKKPDGSGGKTIITKHDKEICSRRNAGRMEDSFPASFLSGDVRGMDLQLPNKIYNSLKQHAFSEERRGQRLHEAKEHYTTEHALDEKTRLILHRMVNNGILASVNGIISVGKESVVIHADGGDSTLAQSSDIKEQHRLLPSDAVIPRECAIKIFKTTLNEFRTRDKYIKDDYRFKDRFKKLNPRKIIHMWAEKEMRNLRRIKEAGILCPEVVLLKKHVLVMSFIGTDQRHAPKLKEAVLSSAQKKSAYKQVKHIMDTMFNTCRLVHADLSEYNLLWKNENVWVIDVSQSVEPNHPHGLEFLFRDCQNMSRFFKNVGVDDVLDSMLLFNEVSGLSLTTTDEGSFRSELEQLQNMSEEHAHQNFHKSTNLVQ